MATAQHLAPARPSATLRPSGPRLLTPSYAVLTGPAVLTVLLGLWGIRRAGTLWQDEAVTYDMAHRSLPDLWATLAHVDAVHGLYYLLMHGVFAVWDGGLVALRLPSVLAMAGAAAGVAALGHAARGGTGRARRGHGVRTAARGPAVRAGGPLVRAGHCDRRGTHLDPGPGLRRTRPSPLGVVRRGGSSRRRAARVRAPRARRPWRGPARRPGTAHGRQGMGGGLLRHADGDRAPGAAQPRPGTAGRLDRAPSAGAVLGFLLTAVAGAACAAVHRRTPQAPPCTGTHRTPHDPGLTAVALPLLLLPPAVLLLVSAVRPLYVDRYVLYAQSKPRTPRGRRPRHAVALGAGPRAAGARGRRDAWRTGPGGAAPALPQSRADDVPAVARALRAAASPGDGVIFLPGSRRVWTLQRDPAAYGLTDIALASAPHTSHTLYGDELAPAGIRREMLRVSRIVVVREPARERQESNEREETKEAVLRDHFTRCERRLVGTARIDVYERGENC